MDRSSRRWLPDAGFIARCPALLAICSAGAGYDVVDVEACTAAGVIVCNNSGPGAEAVAEHALGFMLSLSKKITLADRMLRRAPVPDRTLLKGSEIRAKTLGIVGLGRIGARLAELCRGPFEMEVLAFDPFLDAEQTRSRGAERVDLPELLRRADFVVVSCPLTPETLDLFGAEEFAQMKPGAFFVTTARGEVHDEKALLKALKIGQIAGAGIDVFHEEPPSPDHPLLALDNVVATPHTAGITTEAARAIAVATAEQWISIFDGAVPPRLINPEAWSSYADRFEQILGFRPAALEGDPA
jgi:D-3-phosphoglycerate dehydrogenase